MSDIIIIGAGAVGCLTALEFRRRGANVTLLERGLLGSESSWAGGGILFPLLPWRYREEVNQLALAGARRYATLAEDLLHSTGIDPEYCISGMRVLPDFGGATALEWCATHNIRAEQDSNELWLPGVAQIRNPRLMQALRRQLEIDRVALHEHAEVVDFISADDQVISLQTSSGQKLHADHYIITAGAWSQTLLGKQAENLRVNPMRGQMLLYQTKPGTLEQILYQDDFYLIPRRDGLILAGSTVENVGFDKSTTSEAAHALHQKAIALLPDLQGSSAIKHWSGLRPGSPDNLPTIDRHPRLENLWLNTGHFRYGVTMAPASAEILANLMTAS